MTKNTFKILRCEHCRTFKICLAIFQHYHERVNEDLHSLIRLILQIKKKANKHKCDLLGEKGPTAAKRRFKMQLTAFSL